MCYPAFSLTRTCPALTPSTPASTKPGSAPCRAGLEPARLAGWGVTKEPLNSNYISIWLWGVFAVQRSAASGALGEHWGLRVSVRPADLITAV